jgi:hypothetical protein
MWGVNRMRRQEVRRWWVEQPEDGQRSSRVQQNAVR